ncbi:GNAT family N-acetyltransferase [Cryobacterium sp. MLB-32]|uniref:GNAT family N-acetyltransferase n=1 Tax=Cryobacterium sp. MLB-32 TaxID=1529318 RepID=UPI00068D3298|nr:GNAT family N-acetyltransferase [Cryobacterium sp. MLB-32]
MSFASARFARSSPTDGVTCAWLCDVFVDPAVRGHGIGKALISGILEECDPLGLRRIALSTDDAHGLYSTLGFTAWDAPETWMERIVNPGV